MILTSLIFLALCVVTIFIYFIIPKKFQWIVLLVSSVIFLFWDNLNIATILQALLVLISAYGFGILIDKHRENQKSKICTIVGVGIILGQLICLKYNNLFIITINHILKLFKIKYQIPLVIENSLIGISYYSLIMISYLIDIYRGTCKPQKNIFKCALFMSYFPILTSGPFVRYDNMEKELYTEHKFDYHRLCTGLVRIFWGLFKILVISIRLGNIVDAVYKELYVFDAPFILLAVLAFPLQLYTNFSGSIDVIMGVSEILGISLPENFTSPFLSRSITEFWRNWHITLGAWLKDYIFYPLLKSDKMQNLSKKLKEKHGKNIAKKVPMYISMLIMWTLIGIWHGGAYTFIIGSGLIQFLFMFLEDTLSPVAHKINQKLKINENNAIYKLYQIARTYILFSIAMVFFRASSVSNAIEIFKSLFTINEFPFLIKAQFLLKTSINKYEYALLGICFVVMVIIHILQRRKGCLREKIFKLKTPLRWGILYVLIISVVIFGCYGFGYEPTEFIYRQF